MERPVVDVVEVQSHRVLPTEVRAATHLPGPGDARLDFETPADPRVVLNGFDRQAGTRPDQRHIAFDHIEELRKFIERGPAQQPACPRGSWVLGHLCLLYTSDA